MDKNTVNYILFLFVFNSLSYNEISNFYNNKYTSNQIKTQIDIFMNN